MICLADVKISDRKIFLRFQLFPGVTDVNQEEFQLESFGQVSTWGFSYTERSLSFQPQCTKFVPFRPTFVMFVMFVRYFCYIFILSVYILVIRGENLVL
jgi:hypothetical protein